MYLVDKPISVIGQGKPRSVRQVYTDQRGHYFEGTLRDAHDHFRELHPGKRVHVRIGAG